MRHEFLSGGQNLTASHYLALIRPRVGAVELISPWNTRNNINRPLKFALKKMSSPNAHRYTSNAFRRGDTQELLQSGGTIEIIKSPGAWIGNGFRSYIDLEFNKTRQIPRTLIQLDDSSSDAEGQTHQPKVIRKKHPAQEPSASSDPPKPDAPPSETSSTAQSIYG